MHQVVASLAAPKPSGRVVATVKRKDPIALPYFFVGSCSLILRAMMYFSFLAVLVIISWDSINIPNARVLSIPNPFDHN
jgi:hypothetical protein